MLPDFVRLADLLRTEGGRAYKELVDRVRERFPGRGHVFDRFIEELKPLASGFLKVPDITEGRRSSTIRYWLSEAAQGRGQNFKPVLIRWLWKHDEAWMRKFISRWQVALGWTDEQFLVPSNQNLIDTLGSKPELVILYGQNSYDNRLSDVIDYIIKSGISAINLEIPRDNRDLIIQIKAHFPSTLTVFYNTEFDHGSVSDGDIVGALYNYFESRKIFASSIENFIALNQAVMVPDLTDANGKSVPYIEMPSGVGAVATALKQAVTKLRAGPEALIRHMESLRDKNNGQYFLEKVFAKKASRSPDGVSITLFDIDMTNQINRRFGEDIGDKVIAETVSILMSVGSEFSSDIGRCGDDTFYIAIYDGFNREGDMRHLNQMIGTHDWEKLAQGLRVTCSAGYSGRRPNEAIEDIVIRAALGLEEARRNGGNQLKRGPSRIPNATSRYIRHHFS